MNGLFTKGTRNRNSKEVTNLQLQNLWIIQKKRVFKSHPASPKPYSKTHFRTLFKDLFEDSFGDPIIPGILNVADTDTDAKLKTIRFFLQKRSKNRNDWWHAKCYLNFHAFSTKMRLNFFCRIQHFLLVKLLEITTQHAFLFQIKRIPTNKLVY